MSRHFRPWTIDRTQLLPAAVVDYVPADHLAQFVVALAREHLDLTEIVASYKSGLGQPPFDPRMMTKPCCSMPIALVFIPREGSRRHAPSGSISLMIVAHDAPDFRTIADFQEASSAAAGEAVFAGAEACGKSRAGEARACRARRHEDQGERLQTQGDELRTHEDAGDGLRAEVDRWLEAAQAADAQEDKLHGASRRGDEMPGWIADKQKRLAKIREAREALEAEAASAAAAKAEAESAAEEKRKAENRKRSGPVPRPPSKSPIPRCSATLPIPTAACS